MAYVRTYKKVWVCKECSAVLATQTTKKMIGSTEYDLSVAEDSVCDDHQTANPTHRSYELKTEIYFEQEE
jgi:hypothetical protein